MSDYPLKIRGLAEQRGGSDARQQIAREGVSVAAKYLPGERYFRPQATDALAEEMGRSDLAGNMQASYRFGYNRRRGRVQGPTVF